MPHLPAGHPFRKHSANLRAVSAGLAQAERTHKAAVRRGDAPGTDFAARMHQLMVGLLAEAHLRKIVSDPDGFNAKEQKLLSQESSQLDRWLRAVELAFRRHYAVPIHLEITVSTTAAGVPSQHAKLNSLLRNDLGAVIQDRNKLAHGQWEWLLNNKETAFTGRAAVPLNYLASYRRSVVIKNLAGLIHALVVSEPTFQRDYASFYQAITTIQAKINGPDYPAFALSLQARRR